MKNKFAAVKNPLTVIAIFAGTAEISGTAILPLLEAQSQQTYIWFLMLFPFTLVALFFITLNWNHRVLYAPSDFEDEDNFVNILEKSTVSEQIEKYEKEIEPEIIEQQETSLNNDEETSENSIYDSAIDLLKSEDIIPDIKEREKRRRLGQLAIRSSTREAMFAEKMVLECLGKELNSEIETNMKFNINNRRYLFDGMLRKGNNLTAIEVRYHRDMSRPMNERFKSTLHRFNVMYHSLTDEQKSDFSMIYAIVTENINEEMVSKYKLYLDELEFPVVLKVYNYDDLASEYVSKAS